MSDYQGPQPGTGFLFPNKYHKTGDRQPCLKGTLNLSGVEMDVAVWAPKEGKKTYFMKISDKEDKQNSGNQPDQNQNDNRPVQQPAPPKPAPKKNLTGLMK